MTSLNDYSRKLGIIESISIVLGRIIGSGIFRTPAPIMALVGSTLLFGIVWIIGALVAILGAVCYAELVAMMPKSGGPYVYLKNAYNPLLAFLRGWAMFFVSETAAIAAVAIVCAEYTSSLYALLMGVQFSKLYIIICALAIVWFLTLINLFGVLISGIFQNIFGIFKIASIAVIIILSFTASGNWKNFVSPLLPVDINGYTLISITSALSYSFFAFSGWEGATYIAEEVKNPEKTLPLSLFIGIVSVLVLYMAMNAAYLFQLSPSEIKTSTSIATDVMVRAIGSLGGIVIAIAIILCTFTNVGTQILCKSRTWQAMAQDGLFFKKLAPLNTRYHTPNNSLIAQSTWASILILVASLQKNMYETIIIFFTATSTLFNILTLLSLYIFRRKFPNMKRPYKAFLYPYSLIIIILIYLLLLITTFITNFFSSIIGIIITASGGLYYYFIIVRHRKYS